MRANPTYLAECTWPEASTALDGAVIFLPVGAIEAHGPHLPLNTDVVIARETAVRAAKLLPGKGIVVPEISYGVSFVGTCFAGTTPVPPDALTRMVNEVIVTLLDYGASAAVIVNAHLEPAHIQALADARERVTHATQKPVAFADLRQERWANRLSSEFVAGMRHAGAYETSLMLAARPNSVRLEFLSGLDPVMIDLPAALRAGARTFAEAGGTLGYFGNPRDATAAEGDRLFDVLAAIMIDALGEAEHENAETPEP
jgi:creatinine amidohydrolase